MNNRTVHNNSLPDFFYVPVAIRNHANSNCKILFYRSSYLVLGMLGIALGIQIGQMDKRFFKNYCHFLTFLTLKNFFQLFLHLRHR